MPETHQEDFVTREEFDELKKRVERIEKGLPIEQFIKGLNLLGYCLSIETIKTEGENK